MKRLFCLLLALVLTLGCLAGVCFAEEPLAVVTNGTQKTKAYTAEEIKALIRPDGNTLITFMKDHMAYAGFLNKITTCTIDLNGHTVGSYTNTPISIHHVGTENSTFVIKNGTWVGGDRNLVALNVQVGGMRAENVVFIANNQNAVVGIYQLKGDWNDQNLLTGCTVIGCESSAVAFTSTTESQADVSLKIENTTLLNSRYAAGWGTYPINERQVQGGTIVLGKNVNIYSQDNSIGWIHPNLKHTGETVTYKGQEGAFKVPSLGLSFSNLHHWATPDGGMKNTTSQAIANVKPQKTETTAAAQTAVFADVPASFWGFDAISAAADAGLVKGKSQNADGSMNYVPGDTMTRAEFLTTVLRQFYPEEAAAAKAGEKWWTGYYDLAIAKGVLKAAELENGNLDKPMTREEMALVLYRTAPSIPAYKGVKKASVKLIPDYKTVTNAYKDAVLWVYGAGLIQGMDDKGTFAPQQSLTRAQSATVLAKLVAKSYSTVEHLIPAQDVADTTANRQKAVVETALAYHRKAQFIQYDTTHLCGFGGRSLGDRAMPRAYAMPELATEQRTIYAHCQFYVYSNIYYAFDHEITGQWETLYATPVANNEPSVAPYNVFLYEPTGDEAVDLPKMQEFFDILQPGDAIFYTRHSTTTPHTIIWGGDLTGDGQPDIIHSGGTNYNKETKAEVREPWGSIWINTWRWDCVSGEDYFARKGTTDYFPKLKSVAVLRYTDEKHAQTDPLTERAKTRLLYPGLDINYEVEGGLFASVQKGSDFTYTLTLNNTSKQDYKGLKVNLPVPANAKVVKIDGKAVQNGIVSKTYDIPAGKSVTLAVTVKAIGAVGSVISNGTGYVHAIPLPPFTTAIVSQKEDTAKVKAALESAKGKSGEAFLSAYLKAMGKSVTVPALHELKAALFDEVKKEGALLLQPKTVITAENKTLSSMVIPYFFGGQYTATECESLRVKELRNQDLQAGDILIWQEDSTSQTGVAIHDGETLLVARDGKLESLRQLELDKFIMYRFFIALRPTQAQ